MNFQDYSKIANSTMAKNHAFGDITPALMNQVLGLVGESGEVAEKFKKLVRDRQGQITDADKQEIVKELGDVLWYINAIADLLGTNLETVARVNNQKLLDRQARHKMAGSGDNR